MTLIAHLFLELRLIMSGGVPLTLLYTFMVWTGTALPSFFSNMLEETT
jgi:hypothetical protein